MPELPEVEVICRGLAKALPGRVIDSLDVLVDRSFPGFAEKTSRCLLGAQVLDVKRRGKLVMVYLTSGGAAAEHVLLIHLRMTGQLIFRSGSWLADASLSGGYPNPSLIGELPDRSTRVVIQFTDGARLYFNDQRKFGYLKLVAADGLAEEDFLSRLGPEPLEPGFDWRMLRQALAGRSQSAASGSIKAALLDQEKIAGIGNIYADESLFRARIDPRRAVSSLTVAELKRLHAAILDCLQQSIVDGGSTARNYVDALGLRGEFLDLHAAVYGRAGQPCPRCGLPIVKIRVAGRGTHLCEKCQR